MTELRWIASFSASCFHAAWAVLEGLPLVDGDMQGEWDEAVRGLAREIDTCGLPRGALMEQLCALSAGIDNNTELAQVAARKVAGGDTSRQRAPSLARAITQLETAFQHAVPKVVDELSQRAGPLRTQWEARGPGLMAQIGRLTDPGVVVDRADVVLVHPVLGGGGAAHPAYNSVRIEAVLADTHEQLPEVLRLAWMLSLLNLDLPRYSENIPGSRRGLVTSLAMTPAVLTAAETVQLGRCDAETIALALAAWLPALHVADEEETVARLLNWWNTFTGSRPAWPVALLALEKMLPA